MQELPTSSSVALSPSHGEESNDRIRDCIVWIALLGLIGLIGVIDMPAMFWPGDPNIWREEARSILLRGRLAVDPAVIPHAGPPGKTLIFNPRNGQAYSKYGVMNSIVALLPMWLDSRLLGGSMVPVTNPNLVIFNLWNVALSLLLAAVLMKLSGFYTSRLAVRVIFVLTTFYGTFLWYYLRAQSSEVYQSLFYVSFFLFLVTFLRNVESGTVRVRWLYFAWACAAALVLTRVSYVLLLPLVLVFCLVVLVRLKRPERLSAVKTLWLHLLFPPIAIGAVLGWVNYVKFGAPWLTGYHAWLVQDHIPTLRIDKGLWGFLFMPQYSVFLYFPIAGIGLFAIREFANRFFMDALVAIGTGAAFILFYSSIPIWTGEWTYGPRYMLFVLPVLSLPFIIVVDRIFDRPRNAVNLILVLAIGLALTYSGYLQFRVNSVRFFAFQEIRRNLEDGWPEPVRAYIQDHHVGRTINDLLGHRDNLDETLLFRELKQRAPPEMVEQIRALVQNQCLPMNHYWRSQPESSRP